MNIGYALLLSTLAGLSTTIGSIIAIFFRRPGPNFMSFFLGFSAGVMILVSFVELLHQGITSVGFLPAHIAFFGGMVIMFIIDNSIPHEYIAEHKLTETEMKKKKLARTGLFVALGIAIHNFPEGLATFAGGIMNIKLGIAIAFAIALHNIPEGICVSVPIYAATGSRKKAFWWSFLAGVAEPIGAIIAALILLPFLNPAVLGYVLAAVAGVMVFISIDELVPVSCSFGESHMSILGFMTGAVVMALSIWLMGYGAC